MHCEGAFFIRVFLITLFMVYIYISRKTASLESGRTNRYVFTFYYIRNQAKILFQKLNRNTPSYIDVVHTCG